ncbi:LysR family transcriptional regulator [Paraburkholderia steynii]|uniref:LysR family transcriptional regulator n=1 Tax=Paraburkholderia steynii TaxID=1245441 RepID=A0A4R0X5T5_9BURK|nr:LysR family transcriptional regulator [Paraburkholderia steynii]
MDLNLLKTFAMVAREGSLTQAAKRLHLTQPAVSLQIKNLQRMTGLILFSRASRGLLLTSDGAALLPHVERAIAAASEVSRVATMLLGEMSGCLRIGTIIDPEFLRLGAFLQQLVNTWPRIETRLRHGMSGWVLDKVRSGELDVGYYLGDVERDLQNAIDIRTVTLTALEYMVIAPQGWKDRVEEVKGWNALASLPWIWTPTASAHQRLLSREFDRAGARPSIAAEADQEQSMLDLVKSGVGLTLVRDSVALAAANEHGLTIVKGFTVPARLSFISRLDREREPLIAAIFDLIHKQWTL